MNNTIQSTTTVSSEIKNELTNTASVNHPALKRLQEKLAQSVHPGIGNNGITSYDRTHHRHNRS